MRSFYQILHCRVGVGVAWECEWDVSMASGCASNPAYKGKFDPSHGKEKVLFLVILRNLVQ